MDRPLILDSKAINFCVYGLGTTGQSVIDYFQRKNFKQYKVWDDNEVLRAFYSFKMNKQKEEKIFSKHLDNADYIVLSPGISLKKAKLKKKTFRK